MRDHIDPHGIEFAVACPRCERVHTRAEDEEVKRHWRDASGDEVLAVARRNRERWQGVLDILA